MAAGSRPATIGELSDADIIRLMIGRPVKEYIHKRGADDRRGGAARSRTSRGPACSADISFEVRKGEIVGLGGLVGAGRTDVALALFGIAPADSGSIEVHGKPLTSGTRRMPSHSASPSCRRTARRPAFSAPSRSSRTSPPPCRARSRRVASSAARIERALASERVNRLRIRLATLRQPIGELSGGNQQKAILARWLLTDPSILILDEPTRGIDIGVKAEFYDMIGELAAGGRAILLISSELPELLALCDRVLVMSEGRLTANLPRGEATQETIMQAAVPRGAEREAAA